MQFVMCIKSFILEQALSHPFDGIGLLRYQVIYLVECPMSCVGLIGSSRCITSAFILRTFCKLVINLKPWLDSGSAVPGKDAPMNVVLRTSS